MKNSVKKTGFIYHHILIIIFIATLSGQDIIIDTLSYTEIATDSFSISYGEEGFVIYQMPWDGILKGIYVRVAEWESDDQWIRLRVYRLNYPFNLIGEPYSLEFVNENGWLGYYTYNNNNLIPDTFGLPDEWNSFGDIGPCTGVDLVPNALDPINDVFWKSDFVEAAIGTSHDGWFHAVDGGSEPEFNQGDYLAICGLYWMGDPDNKVTFYAGDGTGLAEPWPFLLFSPQCGGISGEGGWHIRSTVVDWQLAVEFYPDSMDVDETDKIRYLEIFNLNPNYPNPFNASTQINYYLPKRTSVTLNIFNIKGQLIKTLNDSTKPAGNHAITWDSTDETGKDLPSGIYLYQLVIDGHKTIDTQKMVLMR